jgi:mannitol-specific phosphotransferase system IIBC component
VANKLFERDGGPSVTYLIRIAIGLLGGTGTVAAYHETRDPIFTAIVAFIVIIAFVAAYFAYR